MPQRHEDRPTRMTLARAGSRRARRIATASVVLAFLLSLPMTASATYPGSLDGRLAIASNVDGNFDIYTVLPNGQGLLRLTTHPLFDACPAWSADGKRSAFCHGVQAQSGIIDVWT